MKKIITIVLLFLTTSIWSESIVKLDITKDEYKLGELIEADLSFNIDPQFNNVYFDLDYDSEFVEFVEYRKATISSDNNCSVLFAESNSKDKKKGRLIFSVNWEDNIKIYEDTEVLRLVFRAKKSTDSSILKFNNYGLKSFSSNKESIDINATWRDSEGIYIKENNSDTFVWIKSPRDGSVIPEKKINVTLLTTKHNLYTVKLLNETNGSKGDPQNCSSGIVENIPLFLNEGKNMLSATLLDENETILAIDTTTIYYKDASNGLILESPDRNSVVNQNRISVKVASVHNNVKINKERALATGYKNSDGIDVYYRNVWLKPGFNTIFLEAFSETGEVYRDELVLYFEQSDEVFRIISPENGSIKKCSESATLNFKGEISQKFGDNGKENEVTYDINFYPAKYNNRIVSIKTNCKTNIDEFEAETESTPIEAAYKFTNTTPVEIGHLGAGTLEIKAYLNKVGVKSENITTSLVILDDSKLEIILEQPRVYVDEDINNISKIEKFHKLAPPGGLPTFDNVDLHPDGTFSLSKTKKSIVSSRPNDWYNKKEGLLELKKDGTMLCYTNKNSIARFKSLKPGNTVWEDYIPDSAKFYIYDIAETERGLLLGVSNYAMDGSTGLYLLDENKKLINIVIGKPITHVQFIRVIEDTVFLYGNDYSHIYSFNINTLELVDEKYKTGVVESYPLNNSLALKDFQISPSLNTAALITDSGDLSFYSISTSSYEKYKPIDAERFKNVSYITPGNYVKSSYISWLISGKNLAGETVLSTVMERKSDGQLNDYSITEGLPGGSLLSSSFNKDNFHILSDDGIKKGITAGKVFFNRFLPENYSEYMDMAGSFVKTDTPLIFTKFNGIYWGGGYSSDLYNFTSEIEETGKVSFNYINPNIEGLKGFSFNVPGEWIDSNRLKFNFTLNSSMRTFKSDDSQNYTVQEFAKQYKEHENWSTHLSYNSQIKEYKIDVDFNELEKDAYITFDFDFKSLGTASPSINGMIIKKKVPVKIPSRNSSNAFITIKGRVTDPTVKEINIKNGIIADKVITVDSSGNFKVDCQVSSSTGRDKIELTCENQLNDSVTESFIVELFDSVNGLNNTGFESIISGQLKPVTYESNGECKLTTDTVFVNTDYYGLKGALVGYEIFSLSGETLISKGLFTSVADDIFNNTLYSEDSANLESGKVTSAPVVLAPGGQKLKIFVENPGGKRVYYETVFIYEMANDLQKIVMLNRDFNDLNEPYSVYEDCDIKQALKVSLSETTIDGVPPQYVYSKKVNLRGKIDSLQSLSNLKIRTSSNNILLENGTREEIISVDEINHFNFNINIALDEQVVTEEDYYIILQPTAPFLIHLKTVIKLRINKDFTGAHIVPDFSLMDDNDVTNPSNRWTDDERSRPSKPIRVKFDRTLPPGSRLKLVVNFKNEIDGQLELLPASQNMYCLKDIQGNEIELTGVKFGINRIRWVLYYNKESDIISSSIMNKPDMRDFVFNLSGSSSFIETKINFPYVTGHYYNENNLETVTFIKDNSTRLEVFLNDNLLKYTGSEIKFTPDIMLEGKNHLKIYTKTNGRGSNDFKYEILYDSIDPIIGDNLISVDENNNIILLEAYINESNIHSVKLYEKDPVMGVDHLINSENIITPVDNKISKVVWPNISTLAPMLNPKTTGKNIYIVVEDKSGKKTTSSPFSGPLAVKNNPLGELNILRPTVDFRYYDKNLFSAEYRKETGRDINSWVFFDSAPNITDKDIISKNIDANATVFNITRPGNIHLDGLDINPGTSAVENVNITSGKRVSFGPNFSFPKGKKLTVTTNKSGLVNPVTPIVNYPKDFKELSINFSIKLEDTEAFDTENDLGDIKRIITLGSEGVDETKLCYTKERGKSTYTIGLYNDSKFTPLALGITSGGWHNLLINISNINEKFLKLYFDDHDPVKVDLDVLPTDFLKTTTEFYLGEKDGKKHLNGHFAVSELFYVDRLIGSGDIQSYTEELKTQFGRDVIIESAASNSYTFNLDVNNIPTEAGTKAYKLRTDNSHFSKDEDVTYLTDGSALIGSKNHKNYLKNSGSNILFIDCDTPIQRGLTTSLTTDYMTLILGGNRSGRYTFGNRPTNHGIKTDRYYSIAGRVESVAGKLNGKAIDGELVVLFNNKKHTYPLIEGDFHFVYDNIGSVIPESIVMYIETREDIRVYRDIQFVEGNSSLGSDVLYNDISYASTKYYYNNSGTVGLYYKPFNVNALGHIDYETVIFESNLIDIKTKKNPQNGIVEYIASVGDIILNSNIPVMEGWQNLLVTYSVDSKQARFYINGKIVSHYDGNIVLPNEIFGIANDNVFIGGDPGNNIYAEGYIDNLKITNLYNDFQTAVGEELITLEYKEAADSKLLITDNSGSTPEWTVNIYSILSQNINYAPLKTSFNNSVGGEYILSDDIDPGLYFARIKGELNGKRISNQVQFIKDNKPGLKIERAPMLFIANVANELIFNIHFDKSYLTENSSDRYAGLVLDIKNINNTQNERLYLCQDFKQQDRNLWLYRLREEAEWKSITMVDNKFDLPFLNQKWNEEIYYNIETFYFTQEFNKTWADGIIFNNNPKKLIPIASLSDTKIIRERITSENSPTKEYEYMLDISLNGAIEGQEIKNIESFSIQYSVESVPGVKSVPFTKDGFVELYYDDILKGIPYGSYNVNINLIYKGSLFQTQIIPIKWEKIEAGAKIIEKKHYLKIGSLDLLYIKQDQNRTKGSFYLSYEHIYGDSNEINPDLTLYYKVKTSTNNNTLWSSAETLITGSGSYVVIDNVELGNDLTTIEVELFDKINGLMDESINDFTSITVNTSSEAPEIVLTNSVPFYISYNNLSFTWEGLLKNKVSDKLKYTYNFDDSGWSTETEDSKKVELYGLDQGFHILKVKSKFNDKESSEATARFFVDTENPIIDLNLITTEKLYDDDGIIYAVKFKGAENSVKDITLNSFYVGDKEINVNGKGEFATESFPVLKEGINNFILTAFDKVGNKTELTITIDNTFIEILSPGSEYIKYSPFTLVGKISDKITQDVNVYIQDPIRNDIWHKGMVNSDRVFFINDVGINPGSSSRTATTSFRIKIVFGTGTTFYRDITVKAGVLYRPLIVTLSKQATQGAGKPVEIDITAECNIRNIASWSIDYDGDGVYDEISVTDNNNENVKTWKHSYSTLGEIEPRVRVITRDGEYFSQNGSLIIHEQIKSASNTTVKEPIAMGIAHCPDSSEKVFVLNGFNKHKIDVFTIGRNLNYFSNKLYTVELDSLIEGKATDIKVINEESFIVSTENRSAGTIYLFKMNEFGNFVVEKQRELDGHIASIALSDNYLFVTQKNNSLISRFDITTDTIDLANPKSFELKEPIGERLLPNGTPVTTFNGSVYAADREYQRIIEYSENITPINYWGGFGYNDKEFIQPKLLTSYGNRLFIFDTTREDIQVFDSATRVVSSLNNSGGYLENNFFTDVKSIESLGREEGGRLYYYVVALSKSTDSLSLIRLPQWEEMRAKTRNNKIVFLKDKEVFTAKPDGSDLKKVMSTDSLPRIEGVVDYPTLSPDGRRLTFVSRKKIYTGGNETVTAQTWAYDNLYILDIGDQRPTKVPLTGLEGYEIERPVFNSNGDTIAFSARKAGGFWQIYEYNWKNGTITKLFESIENLRFPYYSPDDRFLVYTTDYDGDQDLEVFDKENPDVRIEVTANNFRDSYPVWSRVYPFEISNTESDIESKIAFVSDRGFKKGIHYAYIARKSDNDIRVVTIGDKDVGDTPDIAAIEITKENIEGDYPAFTGDGVDVVYEEYDGVKQNLVKWNYKTKEGTVMNLPEGSQRPSGMRNTITGFGAELQNGNEVKLSWTPYTDHKTFYLLQYQKASESDNFTQKKIYSQDGTTVTGLEMNTEYLMRVIIEENEQKVAETRWLKVKVPEVVARPSYTVDKDNPYLINLHAWKPLPETKWNFSWIIDNQEITTAQTSQDIPYHFSTSGEKTIQLKATNREGDFSSISESFTVNIVSDIEPIIESTLITGDTNYLELNAENSKGKRINMSSAVWTITGPGQAGSFNYTGSKPIIDVSRFRHKVNVNLKLSRQMVNGQVETDVLEINKVVDLDYESVKPIITYGSAEDNKRLILFDGTRSMGNIDWRTSRWSLYADGKLIHREDGVSSFSYLFAETSRPQPYAVSLTVGDASSGLTKTASQTVDVDPAVMEPVIDYEILTLKEDGNDVGVKVVLSATGSKGSNIDFNLTEWNLPIAAQHGEQPKQKGPTAIFNLRNPGDRSQIEVSITLMRQGGTDVTTKTELIQIDSRGVSETEIIVKVNEEIDTTESSVIVMDVLDSKGADIDWKNTEWLVNGQYSFKGPVARVDRAKSGEEQTFAYSVTLYRFGSDPIYHTGVISLDPYQFRPTITREVIDAENKTMSLSVLNTDAMNVDWTRTVWSIWDGNEEVVQKRGAKIIHTFAPRDKALGYPVMVEMYLKNDDTPFYGYESIQIESDDLHPIIQWDEAIDDYKLDTQANPDSETDSQVISFTALTSTGSNIDWSQTKWNFGDGSQAAYGASVQHKYAISDTQKAYKVALTITRQLRNGTKETKITYKTIEIGAEEITPIITAKIDTKSNNLILSAEASEGRGILLDRSVWLFAGKGDSENFSRSRSHVENESTTITNSGGGSVTLKTEAIPSILELSVTGSYNHSESGNDGSSDTMNNNTNFSTQNTHTGAICRRFIEDFNYDDYGGGTDENRLIWVTLFVYRVNSDGSTTGVSLTEQINIAAVKKAGTNGKEYK